MFEIDVLQLEQYTQLTCKGPASLQNLKDVVNKIKDGVFQFNGVDSYLVDLRLMEGTIDTFDRFELGKYMAERIPRSRIASISKKGTFNKIGENVAVNRGARIFATDDESSAKAWLLSE